MKYLRTHQFDIIHGNGPKGALPIILSNKKRFITTIHDLGPFETRFTKIPFEKLLIKYVIKKATIITVMRRFIFILGLVTGLTADGLVSAFLCIKLFLVCNRQQPSGLSLLLVH